MEENSQTIDCDNEKSCHDKKFNTIYNMINAHPYILHKKRDNSSFTEGGKNKIKVLCLAINFRSSQELQCRTFGK